MTAKVPFRQVSQGIVETPFTSNLGSESDENVDTTYYDVSHLSTDTRNNGFNWQSEIYTEVKKKKASTAIQDQKHSFSSLVKWLPFMYVLIFGLIVAIVWVYIYI